MAGKFEIKTCANGKFLFNLKAGNGEIILTSQQYKALAYAKKGIASVIKNAADNRFVIQTNKKGEFFFVLKAKNTQTIGMSEFYPTEAIAKKGIASVVKNAVEDAKIVII